MPVSGREMLKRVSEYAESMLRAEKASRDETQTASLEIEKLLADQSEAFLELARYYLPRLDDDVEREGWSDMLVTLREIRLRKEYARNQVTNRLQAATEKRTRSESLLAQLTEQSHQAEQKAEQLTAELTGQLTADADFQALSRSAAEGQARLEQAHAALTDVEKDALDKLPNFQKSTLFRYLRDSEYGTDHYRRKGISRRLDRWVAGLIGYTEAFVSYQFLTSAPRQMRQLIEQLEKSVRKTVETVEHRQQALAETLGLPQAQRETERLKSERERSLNDSESARNDESTLRHQLSELDSPACQYYLDALKAFQAMLQRTERSLVAARAASTPELTDDQVVARLKHLDELVAERKNELNRLYLNVEQAEKRTSRVNDLLSRCRRAQFDHPQRIFDDQFDLASRLEALSEDSVSAETLYQEMYRHQRLDSPIADQAAAALNGPMAQVLMRTMAQAAGAALSVYATRAGQQHRLPRRNDQS